LSHALLLVSAKATWKADTFEQWFNSTFFRRIPKDSAAGSKSKHLARIADEFASYERINAKFAPTSIKTFPGESILSK